MFRFYFTIVISIFSALYFFAKYSLIMKNPDKYTELQKYELVKFCCERISRRGRIDNDFYGLENLPLEGGYILYPNHQGRYDAIAIILSHEDPLSFVVDSERSKVILLNEATNLVNGKRLDKSDMRNQVSVIQGVSKEVINGRRYIIFPEGGYEDNVSDNTVKDFMPGAFKAAIKAKCPIVPIALIDSYKAYYKNSLKKVKCQVHYLEPITYDSYKDMNSREIADLVKSRICNKIDEVLAEV